MVLRERGHLRTVFLRKMRGQIHSLVINQSAKH